MRQRLRALHAEDFAPYGTVFAPPSIGERTEIAGYLQNLRMSADFVCYINHRKPIALPQTVAVMERHRFSSQAFLPLSVSRYIVAVAPPDQDGLPDANKLCCFVASREQTINYNAGVWHCPLMVLDTPAQFAVLMWRDGSDDDEEFIHLNVPLQILE